MTMSFREEEKRSGEKKGSFVGDPVANSEITHCPG